MRIHRFSDPELYLLKNWTNATSLERSMEAVRLKYTETLDAALDRIQRQHEVLVRRAIHLTDKSDPSVGIGGESWPRMYSTWPSGFWLGCIGLNNLMSMEEEAPYACVWLSQSRSGTVDLKAASRQLRDVAQEKLPQEQFKGLGRTVKKDEADIWYPLTEPRDKLLGMILNNQSHELVDFIVSQFETLTKFTSVMNEIARASKRKRK
jgi:hypothetical protein